jgi:hypothetical protein
VEIDPDGKLAGVDRLYISAFRYLPVHAFGSGNNGQAWRPASQRNRPALRSSSPIWGPEPRRSPRTGSSRFSLAPPSAYSADAMPGCRRCISSKTDPAYTRFQRAVARYCKLTSHSPSGFSSHLDKPSSSVRSSLFRGIRATQDSCGSPSSLNKCVTKANRTFKEA